MSRYEIQQLIGNNWENTWKDENELPVTYTSQKGAEDDLDLFIAETMEAAAEGHLVEAYVRATFRVREVFGNET